MTSYFDDKRCHPFTFFLTSFLSSSAKKTELEIRIRVNQSHAEIEAVPKATFSGGNSVAKTCKVTDAAMAANKYLLVKKPLKNSQMPYA